MASNGHHDTKAHTNGYTNGHTNGHTNGYANHTNGYATHTNGYDSTETHNELPLIAVVGMAMRLPGDVKDESSFWDMLINKKDGRGKVPQSRYNLEGFYKDGSKGAGTVASDHGYFLNGDLSTFDAGFFSMSKAEVEQLDPQQRLLLEIVWEAMESAGQTNWRGKEIGVYVGSFGEDWLDLIAKDPQASGLFRVFGGGDFDLSNRVSYEYDLKGPSMTIRTACSSAMVCLNEACQALYTGLCKSAIVSGSNIITSPTMSIAMHEQGALSPDGICKSFDASANGYARGEGVNAVYIKLLEDAIRDKDPIRGIIRGTAANGDGKTQGLSMPSTDAHESLIRKAYKMAGISDVTETGFVELHATGTKIGDPIETGAVARVFGSEKGILIGGVKPNFGHSEGASGITSLMKVLLALENQTIPPNMHFQTPNPAIPWETANMSVPTVPTPWPEHKLERASVNSFGIGGSNAHVILESARHHGIKPAVSITNGFHQDEIDRPRLIVFSAQHADSLAKITKENAEYVKQNLEKVSDIAYTLGSRREHMPQRSFGILNRQKELELFPASRAKKAPKLAFVFTGQGSQWAQMGQELYRDFPSFRADMDSLNEVLAGLPDPPNWKIEDELLKPKETSRIDESEFAQPLQAALQIGLVNILRSWNIHPDAIVGHSSGEVAAAYGAGAITAGESIISAYYRGLGTKLARENGIMAAVGMGRDEVTPFLIDGAMIGCENSQSSVTLSGAEIPILKVMERIKQARPDVFVRKLKVAMAYHSHLMRGLGSKYQHSLDKLIIGKKPKVPFFSSVTAEVITEEGKLGAEYWKSNSESPVYFLDAVKLLVKTLADDIHFVEIGPHTQLMGPLRQIFQVAEKKGDLTYAASQERFKDSTQSLLTLAGQLWQRDIPVDLTKVNVGGKVLTDLPRYAWQHNASYWHESRITRDWRFRQFPHHETLGSRILEGNDFEPTWRNNLNLSALGWIRDHKVKDDIVFPFAGYVAIVGAAISQLKGTVDFTLRKIHVQSALVMRESESVELITTLRPLKLTTSLDSSWYEFTLSSYSGDSWTKHCSGQVRGGSEYPVAPKTVERFPRTVGSPYSGMSSKGLNYGPIFQGLRDISTAPGKKTAAATVLEDPELKKEYVLHPSTIDCCLQLCIVAMSEGINRLLTSLCVPTEIEELYVGPGESPEGVRIQATMQGRSSRDVPGSAFAVSGDGNVVLSLKGLRVSPLDNDDEPDWPGTAELVFRPDVDFLNVEELIPPTEDPERQDTLTEVEKLCTMCIIELASRSKEPIESLSYLNKFNDWLHLQTQMAVKGKQSIFTETQAWTKMSSAERLAAIDKLNTDSLQRSMSPAAVLIKRVFDNYDDILEGKSEPLEVLLPDDGLTKFYNAIDKFTDYTGFAAALGHENPTLRILEIGAGTGGTSAPLIKSLTLPDGSRMYSKYTYTDISAGFFMNAKERFKEFGGLEFKTLDISKDPIAQGFEAGGYDLIVAANVLHATVSLLDTLTNVRKLLSPRGRVYLQELNPAVQLSNFIMGILPGWWLGEQDGREIQPYITPQRWDVEFKKAGYAGVQGFVYDGPWPYNINANIVARPLMEPIKDRAISILYDESSSSIAASIQAQLTETGWKVGTLSVWDVPKGDEKIISVLDLGAPFFYNIQTRTLKAFQQFLSALKPSACLLWLMPSAQVNCTDPHAALTLGTARTIRSELSLNFTTLELDKVNPAAFDFAIQVLEKACGVQDDGALNPDYEYVLSNGVINVGRYHAVNIPSELPMPVVQEERSKKLQIGRFGLLQTLTWQAEDAFPALKPDHLEIEPVCVGVNFRDVLCSMGIIEMAAEGLGGEASAIVRKVGSAVKDFKVGDRIMTFGGGSFASRHQVDELQCTKIPDTLSFDDAATMPAVYCTVIHAFIDLCNLQKGQTVLIHSASGGVGIAAIQICRMIGAQMYLTAGSEEKVRFLQDTFDFPRERIFHSRDSSFLPDLMKATNNRGVDVVLNSLSGELLHASWQCLAEFGRFVELGKRDFNGHGRLEMDTFEANRSFFGVDLNAFRPSQRRPLLNRIVKFFQDGYIQPIKPQKSYDASDVEGAFRYMQKGVHIGKLVVRMPKTWENLEFTEGEKPIELRQDASYLLIGGLGGLGKAISTWMIERGARSFVYLSRSAASSENQAFVKELEIQGATVTLVSGSVSNLADVQQAVQAAPSPIAGVLQMSLILRDNNFLDITFDEWRGAVDPKVQGTLNIHKALQGVDLDFFVLFSSLSGSTGLPGQSNYAAANTFLNAFVQSRHKQGLAASVIDIGVVGEIGYVAQNQELRENLMRKLEAYEIQETDLIDTLQYSIWRGHPRNKAAADQSSTSYTNDAQVAIGLKSIKPLADPSNRLNWRRDRRVGVMYNITSAAAASGSSDDELKGFLASAESDPSVLDTEDGLDQLSRIIGIRLYTFMMQDLEDLDTSQTLVALGVDSLVTIEIRNWWRRAFQTEVSTLELLDAKTIIGLGKLAASGLKKKFTRA